MGKDTQYVQIDGVFDEKNREWTLNYAKLLEMTSEEFANEIKEDFDDNHDVNRFCAQVTHVSGINGLGGKFEHYVLSIGHSIYSHHYTYFPYNNTYYRTIINQQFYENVVHPFQEKRKWQFGDGLSRKRRKVSE